MPFEELVRLMERHDIKRLPVMRGDTLVGILARDVPDPTADDDHTRSRVIASIEKNDWRPVQLVSRCGMELSISPA